MLMFTTAGPTCLAIFTKSLGAVVELTTLRGVASALLVLLLLPANSVGRKGTGHNRGREGGKQDKY